MENIGINKRDIALDVTKGLAITLVVFIHVVQSYVGNWSALTHIWYWEADHYFIMPLFIFISGYLALSKPDFKMIQRRSQQLIPPYIVWSIILYFFSSFVSFGFLIRSNLIKTLLYDIWTLNPSSIWFLPALLGLCFILYLTRGKPWAMLIAILAIYGLSQIPWPTAINNIHIPKTTWFSTLAWFMPFFTGGYFISKYREKLHRLRFAKWFCLVAFPVFFLLGRNLIDNASLFSWPGIFATRGEMITGFYMFSMALLGTGMAFSLADLLARVVVIRRPLQYLGGITLGIYCSHPLFLTLGIGSGIVRILLTTLVAISLSIPLIWVLQRSRITNYLFLGGGQKLFSRKIITQETPAPTTAIKG